MFELQATEISSVGNGSRSLYDKPAAQIRSRSPHRSFVVKSPSESRASRPGETDSGTIPSRSYVRKESVRRFVRDQGQRATPVYLGHAYKPNSDTMILAVLRSIRGRDVWSENGRDAAREGEYSHPLRFASGSTGDVASRFFQRLTAMMDEEFKRQLKSSRLRAAGNLPASLADVSSCNKTTYGTRNGGGGNCTRSPGSAIVCPQCGYDMVTQARPEMGREAEALRELVASWHCLTPSVRAAIIDLTRWW
jgi:hypothetical protein